MGGSDQCIVTVTDAVNSWGTNQSYLGSYTYELVTVPGEMRLTEGDQNYFRVGYPELGDYGAILDTSDMSLRIEPLNGETDWGLNGEVVDLGDGRVQVTYDFEDEDQLLDWVPNNPEDAAVSIEDGRLTVSRIPTGGTLAVALLNRNLRVESLSYEAELLAGNHINAYIGTVWDGRWNPHEGFGMIHRSGGKIMSINGVATSVDSSPVNVGQVYECSIVADSDLITWSVDNETASMDVVYPDLTRQLALGSWSSSVAFDNIVIVAELEPLED
jgi:hypothetical protein